MQKDKIDRTALFTFKNFLLFFMLFLAVIGIGVLIELGEYIGYAFLGVRDGALLFGGGDFNEKAIGSDISKIEIHGGGWYDSMDDLLVNSTTALVTLSALFGYYFYKKKRWLYKVLDKF